MLKRKMLKTKNNKRKREKHMLKITKNTQILIKIPITIQITIPITIWII